MCGIAGILPPRGVDGRSPYGELIGRMTDALAHRGPDARGVWTDQRVWLGHTRLSIIDLSDAGRQPMLDAAERFVLVYNGEVYNYREIRQELAQRGYVFRSQTDSEVVLAACREWGEGAVERFNGMWALAIWDRERSELFAARDRAGKKPFYYAVDEAGALYFASEVKALRACGMPLGLNVQAAFDFFTQGTYGHLGAQTFFSGVSQLPAAHLLRASPGEVPLIERYWDVPVVRFHDRVPYDATLRRRFRDLLEDAVRLRLRADVPVGATLSGGLDSSIIVAMMNAHAPDRDIHLFTRQYPGTAYDETAYFDAVVARLDRPIVHCSRAADGDDCERLCQVLDHQEEPFGDTSILAHFDLMRTAREAGVPVILSGQGGDELLFGYPSMVNAYVGALLGSRAILDGIAELRSWSGRTGRRALSALLDAAPHALPLSVRDRARQVRVRRAAAFVTPAVRERVDYRRFEREVGRSSLDSYLVQVFKRFAIPHLTHYDDRNAMAFAVEGRMPFLDHRLVELLFSVQYPALYERGVTKRILRESCEDLLPDLVRQRRDKIGFYTPLAAWLRTNLQWVSATLSREFVEHLNIVDAAHLQERVTALAAGDDSAKLAVWRGFILHLWAKRFEVAPVDGPRARWNRGPLATER